MEKELIEMLLKRVEALEKRLERYYKILKIDNELSFILNGSYCFEEDISKIMNGKN